MVSPKPSAERTFEVELKFKVEDPEIFRARVLELTARELGMESQEDLYLAHPSRDFAQTGEAFRIRRIESLNRITYTGPRQPGPTKTREEIEIGFDSGPEAFQGLQKVLFSLGFRPVATVRKQRISFEVQKLGRTILVVIDEVEGLGTFSEIETIVEGASELAGSQAAIQNLAIQLGLDPQAAEPRSYLRMLLETHKPSGPI